MFRKGYQVIVPDFEPQFVTLLVNEGVQIRGGWEIMHETMLIETISSYGDNSKMLQGWKR
jgi:hypothetical protein